MIESKKLIGIVDDLLDIRIIAKALLGSNYDIVEGKTGQEAIDLVKQYPNLAALVLDNSMPIMTGLEALQYIRKTNKDLPILMVSAEDIKSVAREYGADYLEKPYENKNLVAKVKELAK